MRHREEEACRVLAEAGFEVFRQGWPDFLLIDGEQIMAIEYKSHSDRPTERQKRVHAVLNRYGIRTVVLHEKQLHKHQSNIREFIESLPLSTDGTPITWEQIRRDELADLAKMREAWARIYFRRLFDATDYYSPNDICGRDRVDFVMTAAQCDYETYIEFRKTVWWDPKPWLSMYWNGVHHGRIKPGQLREPMHADWRKAVLN